MTCSFFFLRRRFRRTRFTFVGDDGIDGDDRPAPPEQDMPPPDYQQVLAQGAETTDPHAPAPNQGGVEINISLPRRGFFRGKQQQNLTPTLVRQEEISGGLRAN
jgi:hypothetical protein